MEAPAGVRDRAFLGVSPLAPRIAAPQRTRHNGPMTKSELIHRIAQKQPQLVERDVETAVKMMLDQMVECLAGGGRIEIRGFSSFTVRFRGARVGRNPRTGRRCRCPRGTRPISSRGRSCANVLISGLVDRLKRSSTQVDQRIRRRTPASAPTSTTAMRTEALLHGK